MNFIKRLTCTHEVKILPVIEITLSDPATLTKVGVFNNIDFKCVKCNIGGSVSVPVILTTQIPGHLVQAIAQKFISDELKQTRVKVVI